MQAEKRERSKSEPEREGIWVKGKSKDKPETGGGHREGTGCLNRSSVPKFVCLFGCAGS